MTFTPLRVLSVIPGDGVGTSMIFARRQSASLESAGAQVREHYFLDRMTAGGVSTERRALRGIVAEFAPDIVHAHYGTVTGLLCTSIGANSVVVTFRGSDLNPSPAVSAIRSQVGRWFSQLAAQRADGVICVSQQLSERLWVRPRRLLILSSGIDTELFQPRDRQEARQRLGIPQGVPMILFNEGRDPMAKRTSLAREVVDRVRVSRPDLLLRVMRGEVPPVDVPWLMAAADVLLVTSLFEGSPNIVRESLACELPVVSVRVGDVAEHLEGVDNCHLCSDDVAALAEGVEMVLTSGRRAGRRSNVEQSLTSVANELLRFYAECLEGR